MNRTRICRTQRRSLVTFACQRVNHTLIALSLAEEKDSLKVQEETLKPNLNKSISSAAHFLCSFVVADLQLKTFQSTYESLVLEVSVERSSSPLALYLQQLTNGAKPWRLIYKICILIALKCCTPCVSWVNGFLTGNHH